MNRSGDILTEIEEGAHDPDSDLPTLLRRCIQLGSEAKSEKLRPWAALEL
jgi:hypothetical protein